MLFGKLFYAIIFIIAILAIIGLAIKNVYSERVFQKKYGVSLNNRKYEKSDYTIWIVIGLVSVILILLNCVIFPFISLRV